MDKVQTAEWKLSGLCEWCCDQNNKYTGTIHENVDDGRVITSYKLCNTCISTWGFEGGYA